MCMYTHMYYSYSGLSDDGTGSSNSIYDPTAAINGDLEPHIPYAPEVIPEESSGKKYLHVFSLPVNLSNIFLACFFQPQVTHFPRAGRAYLG